MNHLTARVERFALHYDHDKTLNDPAYSAAVERLLKEARSIEVSGKPLFSLVHDNFGVIDFVFFGKLTVKELRRWIDLIDIWFAAFLQN